MKKYIAVALIAIFGVLPLVSAAKNNAKAQELYSAIEKNDTTIANQLIDNVNINSIYKDAPSLFSAALRGGHSDIVKLMINSEAFQKVDLSRYIYIQSRDYKLFDNVVFCCGDDQLINQLPMEMLFQIIEKGNKKALREHLKDLDSYIFHRELKIEQLQWLIQHTNNQEDIAKYRKQIEQLQNVKFSKTRAEVAQEALARTQGKRNKIVQEWADSEPTVISASDLKKEKSISLFKKGNEAQIKNMIKSGEISQESLNNILTIAATRGCSEVVQVLINATEGNMPQNALLEACRIAVYEGYSSVLEILLRQTKVDINAEIDLPNVEEDEDGEDDHKEFDGYEVYGASSLISYLFSLQRRNTCIQDRTNMVKMMLEYRNLSDIDLILDIRDHDYNVWHGMAYYCSDKDLADKLLVEALHRVIAGLDSNVSISDRLKWFDCFIYDKTNMLKDIRRCVSKTYSKNYKTQSDRDDYAEMARLVERFKFSKSRQELADCALQYLDKLSEKKDAKAIAKKKEIIENWANEGK